MPDFKKPKVLKKGERIVSKDNVVVIQVKHLEYDVDGKQYPKCNISIWNQDADGFPMSRPKTLNVPIDMAEDLSRALLSLK